MGYDDDAQRLLELENAFFNALRGNRVKSAARFIHQEHFRLYGQSAGNAKTLLLTARKTQSAFVQTILDFFPQCGSAQTFFDFFSKNRATADACDAQTVGDVFKDGLRKRRRLLKDHTHALAQLHHIVIRCVDVFTVQKNLSLKRGVADELVHARERTQEGRFAAT